MPAKPFRYVGNWLRQYALQYDAITDSCSADPAYRSARRLVLGLLALFVGLSVLFLNLGYIDNKPTTASTGLVTAHRSVSLNWSNWFSEGIWWTGKQTPTPLPFTIHGLFFSMFGYSVRGILVLHALVGALSAWLLFGIASRRFGPWAGVLGVGLCLSMPLFLYITLAGWTFVWATMFLLLAISLTDRAVLSGRGRWFILAGLALGCAGMSRPENYAIGALFVLLAPVSLRFRIAFLLLAFAYPLTQSVLNTYVFGAEPGLRILDDARQEMGYWSLLQEWFRSVRHVVLDRNYSTLLQWCIVPAVLFLGLPRHRLLTGIFAYFWIALFGAYAMRRLSFNHEGYYYAHVVLSAPFLAAWLTWLTGRLAQGWKSYGVTARRAAALAVMVVLCVMAWDRASLRRSYADQLFFRIPEPTRALRDFLTAQVKPGEALVLDYFREVSWMLAELENDQGNRIFYYNQSATDTQRPRLNAARKGVPREELEVMNKWVYENLKAWQSNNQARYVVLLSSDSWQRETGHPTALGHYPMFGLRAAIPKDDDNAVFADLVSEAACAKIVFANQDYLVYDLQVGDEPSVLWRAPFIDNDRPDSPAPYWTAEPAEGVVWMSLEGGHNAATLLPQQSGYVRVRYARATSDSVLVPGTAVCIEASFQTLEPQFLGLTLGLERTSGERYNIRLDAADASGAWKRVHRVVVLPADIIPGTMEVAVVLRSGASRPASVSDITIRPVYEP